MADITVCQVNIARLRVERTSAGAALSGMLLYLSIEIVPTGGMAQDGAAVGPIWLLQVRFFHGNASGVVATAVPLLVCNLPAQQFVQQRSLSCAIALSPRDIARIHEIRAGNDLEVEFYLSGALAWSNYAATHNLSLRHRIAGSDWLAHLRAAQVVDTLVLEVPLAAHDAAAVDLEIDKHLHGAQREYQNFHFKECVAKCRHILETMALSPGFPDAAALVKCTDAKGRTVAEQISVVHANLSALASKAHHESQDSAYQWTREDAEFMLTAAAGLVRRTRVTLRAAGC